MRMFPLLIVAVIFYFVGAKFPQFAAKLGM